MSEAASWIGYSLVIGALLGAAAQVLELGLRQVGRPARAAWLVALAASVLLPLAGELRPAPAEVPVLALPVMTLPAVEVSAGGGGGFDATPYLLLGWGLMSACVLLILARAQLSLLRAAREWRELRLEGGPVWVSRALGPAVVGAFRQRIVVPEWVLELPADARALLLLHEREHARTGDGRFVALAYLLTIVMPWNPLVWWQLARLRHAIELDCDARVLARGGGVRPYGALLLEVGRRHGAQPLLAAAFAERTTRLEQRIRALLAHGRARRPLRAVLLGGFALALFGTAYCVRDPLASGPAPIGGVLESESYLQPELLNRADVQRALVENYPPLLRAAGIGGDVLVRVLIDREGSTARPEVSRSSGHPALDAAALEVVALMRFAPARKDDAAVEAWIELPVVVRTGEAVEGAGGVGLPRKRALALPPGTTADTVGLPRRVGDTPSFTPMTRRPELLNGAEVGKALGAAYPPLLRDAGVGGTATIWFLIDEQGVVRRTRISRTTGQGELDAAALQVARTMRFKPAENEGTPVPVWVEIPIVFQAK